MCQSRVKLSQQHGLRGSNQSTTEIELLLFIHAESKRFLTSLLSWGYTTHTRHVSNASYATHNTHSRSKIRSE